MHEEALHTSQAGRATEAENDRGGRQRALRRRDSDSDISTFRYNTMFTQSGAEATTSRSAGDSPAAAIAAGRCSVGTPTW